MVITHPFEAATTAPHRRAEREIERPGLVGLQIEAEALGDMIVTPVSKNLVHLFHLSQRPKKTAETMTASPEIKKAAVLGAGVMGGGIAHLLISRGIPTVLKDINQTALDAGVAHAKNLFQKQLRKKNSPEADLDRQMSLLTATLDFNPFQDLDLVIEAVVEKMPIKQAVLKETEPYLQKHSLYASNTSALSISELQTDAESPS